FVGTQINRHATDNFPGRAGLRPECGITTDCLVDVVRHAAVGSYFNIPFTMAGFKPGNFRAESLPAATALAGCQELRKFTMASAKGAGSLGVRLKMSSPSMTPVSSAKTAPAFSRSSLMPVEPVARRPFRIFAEMGIQPP